MRQTVIHRLLFYILMLNTLILSAQDRELDSAIKGRPRVEFGLEWGWTGNILTMLHDGYYSTEGYIVDEKSSQWGFHSNGSIQAFVGCNLGRWNISVAAIYQGLDDGLRAYLGSLSLAFYLDEADFLFVGAGLGKERGSPHDIAKLTYMGYGRRYAVTRSTAIDIKARIQGAFVHPDIYEDGVKLSLSRTRKNNACVLGVGLGIALVF